MKILLAVFWGLLLAGCASSTPEGTALSDGSISYTVTCERDWSSCYTSARKVCGNNNFEELDRMSDAMMTSAGKLADRSIQDGGRENKVYTETPREDVVRRVLTFRCGSD